MIAPTRGFVIFTLFLFYPSAVNCWNLNEASKELDQLIDVKSLRIPRDSDDGSPVWLEYEFNTGAGNREEVIVKDISVQEYANLSETGTDWQFLEANGTSYLARTEKSVLSFYKLDFENALTNDPIKLNIEGTVLTFKVITVNNYGSNNTIEIDVVAVVCVKSDTGTSLRWYRLLDEGSLQFFWSWPVQKHIKDMEFIQHGNNNKLLLLDENEIRFGKQYSPIRVYGFSIDFSTNSSHFWLCESISAPEVFDIQVCSIYESISMALQGVSDVFLYEYRHTTTESIFQKLPAIKSQDLKNFVCFESGYLQFLAISGPEAGLFHFFEGEFQYNAESESSFDVSEISWIKDIRLNTYRDESLLLIQLKNATVIALAWQGLSFQRIQLPSKILDQYDLSKATAIPKFGFALGNQFVKLHTELKNMRHPTQHTTDRLLTLQRLLNHSLNHQEKIFDETEARLEKSYLKNPMITGFWNLSAVNVTNATLTDHVSYQLVTAGSKNLTEEELSFDVNAYARKLNDLKQELDEIDQNSSNALDSNSEEIRIAGGVEIFGNTNVTENMNLDNLTVNGPNDDNLLDDLKSDIMINGVPIDGIRFGDYMVDYSGVDFSKINRIEVDGHLFFSAINDVDWNELMENVVWKNREASIPGNTIIEGSMTTDAVVFDTLNDLRYPDDYVLIDYDIPANVTGSKSFNSLRVMSLEGVKTINDIHFDDFIILNRENVVHEEITFENLSVEGSLRIDGEITGIEKKKLQFLNESSDTSSDITFVNLTVLGNVTFERSFLSKEPLNFKDLLLKTDKNIEITGTKTFLGNVAMKSNVTITSGLINGHSIDEFATLDTDQDFPNLTRISSNVTFGNVTFGAVRKLEEFLKENTNSSGVCLNKIVVFKSPVIIDELFFDSLNDIQYEDFTRKLEEAFENIRLENLTLDTLVAEEIVPVTINGVDFANFTKELSSSRTIDEYVIDHLETNLLSAKRINGMSLEELVQLKNRVNAIFDDIFHGNRTLKSLKVTGKIDAKSINGKNLTNLYDSEIGTVVFKEDVSIENLTILGSINGFNFSEKVQDTVLKTDRDIKIDGFKVFDNINCHELVTTSLNGHRLEYILNPSKDQVLKGPIAVNGSIRILRNFNATGKIGDVPYQNLTSRFKFLENNTFELHGDVRFTNDNVTVSYLYANGSIQEINFDDFVESLIFQNESNVVITGTKTFQNSVTFNNTLTVQDKLNDINLKKFREKAVFIDKPFSIESKIVFKDGIKIEKDLIVKDSFESESVSGVDLNELKMNVLYTNRPTYVRESIAFTHVTFESDIEVERFNDVDMSLLIPLHTEQIIPVEVLKCGTVNVEEVKISGKINSENLKEIQKNTFMMTGNQNVKGHMNFTGNAYLRRDFNARKINGIDPGKIVPLNTKSTLTGNFVFESPVTLNQSLRVLGYLNDINLKHWEAVAVSSNRVFQQIISGKWTVFGNVYVENGASDSEILDGINVTELSNTLATRHLEMHTVLAEINANSDSMCEDLRHLKHCAENQIYRFSSFDYLQIIEFDSSIVSVHYFELERLDYLMISYSSCHMHAYLFTGSKFELVADVPDFGTVDRWTTYTHEGSLYFVTSGPESCGRSPVNLWRLKNDTFTHVLDLGHRIDSRKINQDMFLMMMNKKDGRKKFEGILEELEESISSLADEDHVKIILDADQMTLTSRQATYKYDVDNQGSTDMQKNNVGSPEILNFKAGVFEKEIFLYFDKDVSEDLIFICNNGAREKKILQTIKTLRPSSFSVLNFEGSIETLLVFLENKEDIKIYEYKGIQGFVYRDTMKMNVDQIFSFTIRKYTNMAKRHCLALIHDKRLTILEANMYGERLDIDSLTC